MKIPESSNLHRERALSMLDARRLKQRPSFASQPEETGADGGVLDVSDEAKIRQSAVAAPEEVRTDRVAALRARIQRGEYAIPAQEIARRLLGEDD